MPPALFLIALLALSRAAAAPAGGVRADIRVGFDGYVVPDVWIPLAVRLESDRAVTATLEVMTTRTRPPGTERVRLSVHLVPGTPYPVTIPIVVHDVHAPLTVRLVTGDRVLGQWRVVVPPTRLVDAVVVAVSRRPVGLQQLLGEESRVRAAYLAEEDLPARWELYEGVAAVVLRDLDERRLVPAQGRALADYVATGGRLYLAAPPPADILSHHVLRPLLAAAPAPVPSGAERLHPWGRGGLVVMPTDPFRSDLSSDAAAVWARTLAEVRGPGLVDRTLLELLPRALRLSVWVQALIVLTLGLYLLSLRWLARLLQSGHLGVVVALVIFTSFTLLTAGLNTVARRGTAGLIQATVAQGLINQEIALVESAGRVIVPRGGAFRLESGAGGLIRATAAADTVLTLSAVVRFEGRADGSLPVRAAALLPLPIRGTYRETPEGVEVNIRNRTGRLLRGGFVVLGGRVQALPPVGAEAHLRLTPLDWREAPAPDAARGPADRLLAWAIGRLRGDAILSATVSLVAWLDDDRGVLRWAGLPAAPLLLVFPLSPAEAP